MRNVKTNNELHNTYSSLSTLLEQSNGKGFDGIERGSSVGNKKCARNFGGEISKMKPTGEFYLY